MNETTKLLNLSMLARRLKAYGVTQAWLKAEAEAGRIPSLQIGRRRVVDAESVEAALLARARGDDASEGGAS